jgi:hypothetical protein
VFGIGDSGPDHRRGSGRGPLELLFTERGEPAYIRSDNGPEFLVAPMKRWLAASGARSVWLLNPYGVCGHRSSVASDTRRDTGDRISTQTLIVTGTENGGQPSCAARTRVLPSDAIPT